MLLLALPVCATEDDAMYNDLLLDRLMNAQAEDRIQDLIDEIEALDNLCSRPKRSS
jgi:hypothetical protein